MADVVITPLTPTATSPGSLLVNNAQGQWSNLLDVAGGSQLVSGGVGALPFYQTKPYIDVRDPPYFAKGDGLTDDTSAIQAAITATVAAGGGKIYLPAGRYMLRSGLNLTGITLSSTTVNVTFEGAGMYATTLLAGFTGGTVLDLSNSSFLTLANFRVAAVATFTPAQVLLMARPTNNNSSGTHTFSNVWLDGTTSNATVVMWGSESNRFYSSLVWSSTNKPALVSAVKISELGFTPTSSFQTLGTGEGGATFNSFYSTQFGNETGIAQTVPLLKLYGALGWRFDHVFFAADTTNLIEINASTYPSDATSVYYSGITFDDCAHENPWGPANTDRTLYFSTPVVAGKESAKWITVRNSMFFNIYAEDNTAIDGFVYEGGKYSNSIPAPSGFARFSVYNLSNSRIAPSKFERALTWQVRNAGDANVFENIDVGKLASGSGAYHFADSSRNVTESGSVLSLSASGGIGYGGGAGGSVAQTGAAGNTVTLNTVTGRITTVALTTAAGAMETFAVSNSRITSLDTVVINLIAYGGAGTPHVWVQSVDSTVFIVVIKNEHAANALNAAVTINFAVIRGING